MRCAYDYDEDKRNVYRINLINVHFIHRGDGR